MLGIFRYDPAKQGPLARLNVLRISIHNNLIIRL